MIDLIEASTEARAGKHRLVWLRVLGTLGLSQWACECGRGMDVATDERWKAERSWRLHRSACEAWAMRRAKP